MLPTQSQGAGTWGGAAPVQRRHRDTGGRRVVVAADAARVRCRSRMTGQCYRLNRKALVLGAVLLRPSDATVMLVDAAWSLLPTLRECAADRG